MEQHAVFGGRGERGRGVDEPYCVVRSGGAAALLAAVRSVPCGALSASHVGVDEGIERRQRAVFSTTLWIHTNLTSIPVDLVIYDGQLSTYVSNNLLASP